MAVVAHTPYSGNTDCKRTNDYLTDGHGLAVHRVNRYISDGHGQSTLCEGYNCPSDPVLATEYMETLRFNYERQHPPGDSRRKGSVTHVQLYISPTEEDNVPAEERMDMMLELIESTPLRDFASIRVPHDNTPDKHGHISLCPYSIDGTHKLCLNNALLNDLRREMDRICVRHGYSIVENPELWDDKEYREWFFQVKEEGIIKIHPPKEQDMSSFKKERQRANSYATSKERQRQKAEDKKAICKELARSAQPGQSEFFYESPYLYNPYAPDQPLRFLRTERNGHEMGELELRASALLLWAHVGEKELKQRKIKGSEGLQKRLSTLADNAYEAKRLLCNLDIRTLDELIRHTRECGQDIADLKQDIAYQVAILQSSAEIIDAIDRWENLREESALTFLKEHHCSSADKIAEIKQRCSRATARKETNLALLQERSAEYRRLKKVAVILQPLSSASEWQEYLEALVSKEASKRIGFCSKSDLIDRFSQMGKVIGMSEDDISNLIDRTTQETAKTTWVEYRGLLRVIYTASNTGKIVSAVYDEIGERYDEIRRLRKLADSIEVIGPITLVLSLILFIATFREETALRVEIEQLQWEAAYLQLCAQQARNDVIRSLKGAKRLYAIETINATAEDIEAARERFFNTVSTLLERVDIYISPQELQDDRSLQFRIAEAEYIRSKRTDADLKKFLRDIDCKESERS